MILRFRSKGAVPNMFDNDKVWGIVALSSYRFSCLHASLNFPDQAINARIVESSISNQITSLYGEINSIFSNLPVFVSKQSLRLPMSASEKTAIEDVVISLFNSRTGLNCA